MKGGIKLSRRGFLRLALLGGIGAGSGVIWKSTESVGFPRWFSWMAQGQAARWFGPRPVVCLTGCSSYEADLTARLSDAWDRARMPSLRGLRVVLKPNLVEMNDKHPTVTDRAVTQGMIQLAREQGAREIVVAEGSAFRRDAEAILDEAGYTEMLEREQVRFVDLNYDDLVDLPLKGGYVSREKLFVARTICDADILISIPKLKTHHWTGLSVSVKNLFGIVPGIKYGWPKNTLHTSGISAFLVELVASLPVRAAAVVDGIVAMEGDGPLFGTAVPSGVLVVGQDLVAVDATCARLVGMEPSQLEYLNFAGWAGVGTIDSGKIDLVGEPLAQFVRAFKPAPLL